MIEVYINNTLLPDSDIIKISDPATEKLQFSFSNLISASISIDINNIDPSKYDDEVSGSMFADLAWYNATLRCVDTETALTTWNGRIKNVKKNDSKSVITIESNNYIKEIIDAVCIIDAGALSDITPAEIAYTLIKDVADIPEAAINTTSFDNAKALQTTNSGFIIVKYNQEQNVKCGSVLNEILRVTSSRLYTVDNIIYYSQLAPYNGDPNLQITEEDILINSYASEYGEIENIYNDYSIAYYSSSSAIAYAAPASVADYMTDSRTRYGTKTFIVPEDEVDSTTPADYNILCKSLTSARYYGDLAVRIGHYIKKIINIDIRDSVEGVALNTLIDFSYKHWVREPARIIERKISKDKHTAKIKAELINFPYQFVSRDKTPPAPVMIVYVKLNGGAVEVYWTLSDDAQFKQYLLEFSTSKTDYKNEYSEQGYSPIAVVSPDFKLGLCMYSLTGLLANSKYYFRVKVMDISLNVSEPSNVMTILTGGS